MLTGSALGIGLLSQETAVIQAATDRAEPLWLLLGLCGQTLFTGRFIVQLYASEQAGASVNPVQFWYLSLSGSLLLLGYALHTADPVIVMGQSFGLFIYLRNLLLFRNPPEDNEPLTTD